MEETDPTTDGVGVGRLVSGITEDLSTLVRKEVELAKLELSEIIRSKLIGGGLFLVSAVLVALVVPFVMLTLVEVLSIWLDRWLASLIITLVAMAGAAGLFLVARKQIGSKFIPKDTLSSLKEDVEWAKSLKK